MPSAPRSFRPRSLQALALVNLPRGWSVMPFRSRRMMKPWLWPKRGFGRPRKLSKSRGRPSKKILDNAKTVAKAEGRAEAEKAAAEAAKKTDEDAEVAKREAMKEAVTAFVAEDWKVETQKAWVASVVEASVDEWVRGPGAMWLAQKGKEYYDGGEYFTQALIYRRLARQLGTDPSAFDPVAYGLPPLQPDTRIPLPEGAMRPDFE
ncbi:unnamed protein product, partial [Cuscuta europaea]